MAAYDFSRYLNIRSAYSSSFAPRGDTLAFITNITGVPQVWEVSTHGGWPDQRTFFSERVSFVEYASAAERAVFGMDVGGSERTQLYLLTSGGEQCVELTPEAPGAIHTFGAWSRDGSQIGKQGLKAMYGYVILGSLAMGFDKRCRGSLGRSDDRIPR